MFHTRTSPSIQEKFRAGTAPLMEISCTFSRPMKAMNRPMPAEMALLRKAGMEAMILLRRGLTAIIRNRTPLSSTMARASCQV